MKNDNKDVFTSSKNMSEDTIERKNNEKDGTINHSDKLICLAAMIMFCLAFIMKAASDIFIL